MRIFLRLRFNLRVRFFFHLAVVVYSWKEREKLLRVSFSVAVVLPKRVRVLLKKNRSKKNCENKISARARLIHRAEKKNSRREHRTAFTRVHFARNASRFSPNIFAFAPGGGEGWARVYISSLHFPPRTKKRGRKKNKRARILKIK